MFERSYVDTLTNTLSIRKQTSTRTQCNAPPIGCRALGAHAYGTAGIRINLQRLAYLILQKPAKMVRKTAVRYLDDTDDAVPISTSCMSPVSREQCEAEVAHTTQVELEKLVQTLKRSPQRFGRMLFVRCTSVVG